MEKIVSRYNPPFCLITSTFPVKSYDGNLDLLYAVHYVWFYCTLSFLELSTETTSYKICSSVSQLVCFFFIVELNEFVHKWTAAWFLPLQTNYCSRQTSPSYLTHMYDAKVIPLCWFVWVSQGHLETRRYCRCLLSTWSSFLHPKTLTVL